MAQRYLSPKRLAKETRVDFEALCKDTFLGHRWLD
jgi:hypothetical protein